jgi:hypothetical protein
MHQHPSQSKLKIEAQVSYPIRGVDIGRGAAVEEELHGLYARIMVRGDHQHSLSILHKEGREGEMILVGNSRRDP